MTAPATSTPTTPRPHVVIVPGSTPIAQYLKDLWHHRELMWVMGTRTIKLRYRQTALGVVWVVLQPLLAAGILGFVFGNVADLPTGGIPPFVFSFAGLLAWNTFSQGITRTTAAYVSNAGLVAKTFFPRLVLPISTVLALILDFTVALALMFVLLFTNDLGVGWEMLALPVFVVLVVMLALGIGSVFASLSVRYRDVPTITPFIIQFGLYATPVAYSVSAVPEKYQTLYYLNPMAGLLDMFRWSIFGEAFPPARFAIYAIVVTVVAFFGGLFISEKMEPGFADVI
jgi:lipopolysaccharide transport system permease protein